MQRGQVHCIPIVAFRRALSPENGSAEEDVMQDILPGACRRDYFIRIIFCVFVNLPAVSRA